MSFLHNIEGLRDILPKDHLYFTYFKKVVRHRCRHAGYRRVTTPIFEDFEMFKKFKLIDEAAEDLLSINIKDKKLTLVTDRISPLVRSYVENNMKDLAQPVEIYYIETLFNSEFANAYEYIQSQSFGLAVMGENDSAIDAQVIQLMWQILDDLGIRHLTKLKINNVGSSTDQVNYSRALQDFYIGKERSLCENCNKNLHVNPFKLLSCESEDCKILAELAPKYEQFLSKESELYLSEVKKFLEEIDIKYEVDRKLFLKENYYTNLIFQFEAVEKIKAGICRGGRSDNISKLMKTEELIPCFGAQMNIDAVIALMRKEKIEVPSKDNLHVFVAQLGPEAKIKCLKLIKELRNAGIKCVGGLGKGSMKDQLALAQKFKVPYTILLGITEVKEGVVIVRDMKKGVQHKVSNEKIIEEVVKLIGEDNLDRYHPGELVYS